MGRLAVLMALAMAIVAAGPPPFRARRRPGLRPNRLAQQRVRLADWPAEPRSPASVDPATFARALNQLCGWMPPARPRRYADWILASAAEFEVDPFVIGALVYRESRCRPDAEDGDYVGLGLTRIHREMYAGQLRRGRLRVDRIVDDRWVEESRTLDRFPFAGPRLRRAEENLYFAAALLRMWEDQHATVDEAFTQVPHRTVLAHWVWGDRVRSARPEDRILTDRRRLLEYYGAHTPPTNVVWQGIRFSCPLDGCPRVISSYLGSEREGGRRHHRGVDLESLPGEPVRAMAPGMVVFAGVDLPGAQTNAQLRTPEEYERYPRDGLAAGGRYVCLRHATPDEGSDSVRTCYMHLEEVHVAYGDRVTQGQQLGTVGRTGMRRSAAHLHLELHHGRLEDPSEALQGLLLGHRESDPLPRR
jgi:murein DD-endopeptidase MepM/ murein hydrolase activator NlpD